MTLGLVGWGCGRKPATNQNDNQNLNQNINTNTATSTEEIDTSDWKTYRNEEYGYEVNYPDGWKVVEASSEKSTSERDIYDSEELFDPEIQKVTFLENTYIDWQGMFQIKVLSNLDNYTPKEWLNIFEESTPLLENASDITIDSIPAKRLSIYAFDHHDIKIGIIYHGNIFIIKFTGKGNPNDSEDEKHWQISNKILSSFKFIK